MIDEAERNGSVVLSKDAKHWLFDVRPSVAAMAKRIFPSTSTADGGKFMVANNAKNCELIDWLTYLHPLKVKPATLCVRVAEESREKRAAAMNAVQRASSEDYTPPEIGEMALPARPHQLAAVDLHSHRGRMLLADELGLGKTVTSIATIARDPVRRLPALVVCPVHIQRQWLREFNRFLPDVNVWIIPKANPDDKACVIPTFMGCPPDVYIITYTKLAGWADTLAGVVKYVVFDEVQELRNGTETSKGKAAEEIVRYCDGTLGLSATPIFNYGSEIWRVMQFIEPYALGDRTEFCAEWCGGVSGPKAPLIDAEAMGDFLRAEGLMLRRTREEAGRGLPGLSRITHEVEADEGIMSKIDAKAAELARVILGETAATKTQVAQAERELSAIVRKQTGISKAPAVCDFVEMLLASEPVVLFGYHRAVYDIIAARLKDYRPAFVTGHEDVRAKAASVEKFVRGETDLLVVSLRSGAGIDGLQGRCRTVVKAEFGWTWAEHEQAEGRVYREGQEAKCIAYYAYADTGSDPAITDVISNKRLDLDGIRGGGTESQPIDKREAIRSIAARYLEKAATGRTSDGKTLLRVYG